MNKLFRVISLSLFILIFLTGCVDYQIEMGINSDKSMDFKWNVGIDLAKMSAIMGEDIDTSSLRESTNDLLNEEEKSNLEARGYKVNEVVAPDKKNIQITVTKKFSNIDDIAIKDDLQVDLANFTKKDFLDKFFKVEKGLFKNKYIAYIKLDEDLLDSKATEEEIETYSDYFDMQFIVKLPHKLVSSNATTVDNEGKTLTWDILKMDDNIVKYEFTLTNPNFFYFVIGVVIIILLIIFLAIKNNRRMQLEKIKEPEFKIKEEDETKETIPLNDEKVAPVLENTDSNDEVNK